MKLELEPAEIDYIGRLLTQRPWAEVNNLIIKIEAQLRAQQAPPPVDSPPPETVK